MKPMNDKAIDTFNDKDFSAESKLLIKELGESPYRKFNTAFTLMALLPFLATFYLLVSKLFTLEVLRGEVGFILFISLAISLCGYWVGYTIISEIFNALIRMTVKARHSDHLKSLLVASVSHEFKNPLSSLKLCLFDMADGLTQNLNEEQKEMLFCCNEIVDRLSRLVNDLLDIYKIEAGIVDINRKLCNVAYLVEKQIKEMEVNLNQKNIKLTKEFKGNNIAWADEDKILRVINNLLSNAIKYTPPDGSIVVRIKESDGFIKLDFQDNGAGIPLDQMGKIFNKFEKMDLDKKGGTGLGLAISKDIIELHNGKIIVESKPGIGSKFTVFLPQDLRQASITEKPR
jgi:signal transduction histidine kinase